MAGSGVRISRGVPEGGPPVHIQGHGNAAALGQGQGLLQRLGRGRRSQGNAADLQPAGAGQQRRQRHLQLPGRQGLIGETRTAATAMTSNQGLTRKALKAPFASGTAPHQHDPGGALSIPLHCREVHTALRQQPGEGLTDGIAAEPTHERHRRAEPGQTAGHVGGGTAEPVVQLLRRGRGWITAGGTKPIHQRLPKTDHLRQGRSRIPFHR